MSQRTLRRKASDICCDSRSLISLIHRVIYTSITCKCVASKLWYNNMAYETNEWCKACAYMLLTFRGTLYNAVDMLPPPCSCCIILFSSATSARRPFVLCPAADRCVVAPSDKVAFPSSIDNHLSNWAPMERALRRKWVRMTSPNGSGGFLILPSICEPK